MKLQTWTSELEENIDWTVTVFCQPAAPFLSGFYDLVKKKKETGAII